MFIWHQTCELFNGVHGDCFHDSFDSILWNTKVIEEVKRGFIIASQILSLKVNEGRHSNQGFIGGDEGSHI
jgi:hypothetical protein